VTVRDYTPSDESGWLRCRALAFLPTAYFDDVLTAKPVYEGAAVELVAGTDGEVVGLVDVTIAEQLATIETIAAHPDVARRGIGSQLLDEARRRLPDAVQLLDAWTRDDEAANAWYLSRGFEETYRYLHVYASSDSECESAIKQARDGLTPVAGFFHADIADEAAMRRVFSRVHICRRYVLRP
jgi:ribosomal protein S18 acetylase RimI-like enzyme